MFGCCYFSIFVMTITMTITSNIRVLRPYSYSVNIYTIYRYINSIDDTPRAYREGDKRLIKTGPSILYPRGFPVIPSFLFSLSACH